VIELYKSLLFAEYEFRVINKGEVGSLAGESEGGSDAVASFGAQDVLALSFEGVADRSGSVHDELDGLSDLELASLSFLALLVILPEEVLIVEVLSEDGGKLGGSASRVGSGKAVQVGQNEFGNVINLAETLLEIVSDREAAEPVLEELTSHGRVSSQGILTVLDDLTERSNGVVSSMVELVQLHLLLLDGSGRLLLDSSLEGGKALLHDGAEVLNSTALGNDSNSIGSSLTERGGLGVHESADGLDKNLVIGRCEVVGSEVLHDIVKNE